MGNLYDRPNGPSTGAIAVANQIPLNQQAAQAGALPATLSLVAATETVMPNPNNTTVPLLITLPPDTPNEQAILLLVASGYIKTTAAGNITIKLYSGTSLTVGSDTLLGSSGAIAQNSAIAPFWALAHLIYDSVSGKLTGKIEFFVNGTIVAAVAVSNTLTGISNSSNPVASFLLSFTSSGAAGGTPTTVSLAKFSVG
jgi:hypothetical protein